MKPMGAVLPIALWCLSVLPSQAQQFVTIGTGAVNGVYYPTGSAICKLINQDREKHHTRCTVESTGGSLDNAKRLKSRHIDFAILQSDWQHHIYYGSNLFTQQGGDPQLRAMFSLHQEPFNLIVQNQSQIHNIQDLLGSRVDIGNQGSGERATMENLMLAMNWKADDFSNIQQREGSMRSQALCRDKIDAYVYVVGHPNDSIAEAVTACQAKLVSVTGPQIARLVASHPYYTFSAIPAGMYSTQTNEVQTFGVVATFVTHAEQSNNLVYLTTKSVFENLHQLQNMHPALSQLKAKDMVKQGVTIPMHPGAMQYFKEVGLLKNKSPANE